MVEQPRNYCFFLELMPDLGRAHHMFDKSYGEGKWDPLGYINGSRPTTDVKKSKDKSTRSLKIIYTNADTLTNKLDELNILIADEKPDLVAIIEVLPKFSLFPVQKHELQIDGYSLLSNLLGSKEKSSRGILLYIQNKYSYVVQESHIRFQEHLFVDVTTNTGSVISVGLLYRSPNSSRQNNDLLLKSISDFCEIQETKLSFWVISICLKLTGLIIEHHIIVMRKNSSTA